jgi:hypothetical protein
LAPNGCEKWTPRSGKPLGVKFQKERMKKNGVEGQTQLHRPSAQLVPAV